MTILIVSWVDRAIKLFAASPTNIPIKICRETALLCPEMCCLLNVRQTIENRYSNPI
ncbi:MULTISPECIES: hypothetical protein [unclassified Microcoleus]|uniref:hypothetical protein n=1 Tax=unclassified Microcoleus TaxID=2642155 RepID=UPI002FD3232B